MELENKNIIITGGAGGIGTTTVKMLKEKNCTIGIVDNNEKNILLLKKHLDNITSGKALYYPIDAGDITKVEKSVNDFIGRSGHIDILINNSAILKDSPLISIFKGEIKKISIKTWNKTMASNLNSFFYFTREVVEKMILQRTKGIIINISSISSSGNIGQTSYAASKSAINALTVTWSQEFSAFGIRVAGLAPGMTNTSMPINSMTKQQIDTWINKIPLRRMAEPQEISHGIKFIIENDYFSGRTLELDGGLRM